MRLSPLYGLVNSAAIFEPLLLEQTTLEDWEQHMAINLTAPFLLSQAFAKQIPDNGEGRIVNILDWRALRPKCGSLSLHRQQSRASGHDTISGSCTCTAHHGQRIGIGSSSSARE